MNDTTRSLVELAVMLSGGGGSIGVVVTAFIWNDVRADLADLAAIPRELVAELRDIERADYARYAARHRADRPCPRHRDNVLVVA